MLAKKQDKQDQGSSKSFHSINRDAMIESTSGRILSIDDRRVVVADFDGIQTYSREYYDVVRRGPAVSIERRDEVEYGWPRS